MIAALICIVGAAIALVTMCWAAFTAPLGWEDDDGFHLGEPD